MKDLGIFIQTAAKILSIKRPVTILLKNKKIGQVKKYCGLCVPIYRKGKLISYSLYINLELCMMSDFPIIDVIAHEMVHACMIEHDAHDNKNMHDKKFQKVCKLLEKNMTAIGFPLGKLYHKGSDT